MFSTAFYSSETQSYFYFGGYEASKITPSTWSSLANNIGFWELATTAVWVGDAKASGSFATSIVDTGTSLAYFPTSTFNSIISKINRGCVYSNTVGLY